MVHFHLLHSLDLFGTIVFAMSGALLAYEQNRNGLSTLLYAGLTALGGGTIRDLLLARPIFWLRSPAYLLISLSIGILTFVLATTTTPSHHLRNRLWLADGLSLATFSVIGTQIGIQQALTAPHPMLKPMVWVLFPLMGLLTGVGGGIVRDLLSRQTPYAIQSPSYPLASLSGGSLYSLLARVQVPDGLAIALAIALTILILPAPAHMILQWLPIYPPEEKLMGARSQGRPTNTSITIYNQLPSKT